MSQKKFHLIVNAANVADRTVVDVTPGVRGKGNPVRIKAQPGAKYQLQELERVQQTAPEYVKAKRKGKDLVISFSDDAEADLVIEGYYSEGASSQGLIGQAENGSFYDYIPEDPNPNGLIGALTEQGPGVNLVLGGSAVTPLGVIPGAWAGIAPAQLIGGVLGAIGVGALASGGGSGGGSKGDGDTVAPTIAIKADKAALKAGETSIITFTLSESSTDFGAGDIVVDGGTLSNFSGSGATYTALFTPTPGHTGAASISVASGMFSDSAGNLNADGADVNNTVTLSVDTVAPTIAITVDKPQLNNGETATVTFTLSEASGNFVLGDIAVSGGGVLGALTKVSDTVYTAQLTQGTAATVISVASGAFTDAAGNANADGADTNNSVTVGIRDLVIYGNIAAGAVYAGVIVEAYGADGKVLGTSGIDADGNYRIEVAGRAGYRDAVLLRVIDVNDATDGDSTNFRDATTGAPKDLNVTLRATDVVGAVDKRFAITVPADVYEINITPVTELAVRKMGVAETQPPESGITITATNQAIGNLLGIQDISAKPALTTGTLPPDGYGLVLAAMSGADALNNGDMDATVTKLADGLKVDIVNPSSPIASFKPDSIGEIAKATLVNGAIKYDGVNAPIGGQASALDQVWTRNDTLREQIKQADALSSDELTAVLGAAGSATTVSGATAPHAELRIVDTLGNVIKATADADGQYTVTFPEKQVNGFVIVTSGKESETSGIGITTLQVNGVDGVSVEDDVAPQAPVVVTTGVEGISGIAEPGSVVTLLDDEGQPVMKGDQPVTVKAGTDGKWTVPAEDFPGGKTDGFKGGVVASDASDNISLPTPIATIDGTHPTIAITAATPALKAGQTSIITFVLSEASDDFDANDIAVSGGKLSSFTGSGSVYTAIFTPDAGFTGDASVSVASGKFSDGAGNFNLDGNEPNNTVVLKVNPIEAPILAQKDGQIFITLPDDVRQAVVTLTPEGEQEKTVTLTKNPVTGLWDATALPNGSSISTNPVTGVPVISIPNTALKDGTNVTAAVADVVGNTSAPTTLTGIDTVAPLLAPAVNIVSPTKIIGAAEAGSTVRLVLPDATVLTTQADSGGNYEFVLSNPLKAGDPVVATAVDAAGNASQPGRDLLEGVDTTAPTVPVLDPSDGDVITGKAEPGSTVTLLDAGGRPVQGSDGQPVTAVADPTTGSFTLVLPAGALDGNDSFKVVAKDVAGNISLPAIGTLPISDPALAQYGDLIVADLPDGLEKAVLTFTPAGASEPVSVTLQKSEEGVWTPVVGTPEQLAALIAGDQKGFTLSADAVQGGARIEVVAIDAQGVELPPLEVLVDNVDPVAPTIDPVQLDVVSITDTIIVGRAEPGSIVTLTFPDGKSVTVQAGPDTGAFAVLIPEGTVIRDGEVIKAVATDAAGNQSLPSETVVGGVPLPDAPVIDSALNDLAAVTTTLTGTAQPGQTVKLFDKNGQPVMKDGQQLTALVDPQGGFVIEAPLLTQGDIYQLVAVDPMTHLVSYPAAVTGDTIKPVTPLIAQEDGAVVVTLPTDAQTAEVEYTPAGADQPVILTLKKGADGSWPSAEQAGLPAGSTIAVVDGNPVITIPATSLSDGTPVTATAADAAGNPSETFELGAVDAVAPLAPQMAQADGKVAVTLPVDAQTAEVVYTPAGTGAPVTLVLEKDAAGNWPSAEDAGLPAGSAIAIVDGTPVISIPSIALEEGTSVTASTTDAAGNESVAGTLTKVDSTAPGAPVIEPILATDTLVRGLAEPGATVTVTFPDGSTATTTAEPSGAFAVKVPQNLLKAGDPVTAVQSDPAGNTSPLAAKPVSGLDTTPPAQPVVETFTHVVGADNVPEANSITGKAEPGSTVQVKNEAGDVVAAGVAGPDGSFSITTDVPLPDGKYDIVASDIAGNTSQPIERVLDTTAPTQPAVAQKDGDVVVTPPAVAQEAQVTFTPEGASDAVTVSVAKGPDDQWAVTEGTLPTGSSIDPATGEISIPNETLKGGTDVTVTATDEAGNTSPETTLAAVDNTGPIPAITQQGGNTLVALPEDAKQAEVSLPLLDGSTATVALEKTADGWQLADGSALPAGVRLDEETGALTVPNTVLEHEADVIATATDKAGNQGQAAEEVDTRVEVPAPVLADDIANTGVTASSQPTLSGVGAKPGDTITIYNGTTPVGTATVQPDGSWTAPLTQPLADGPHTLSATATDPAGNVSAPAPITFTVAADASVPTELALHSGNPGTPGEGITSESKPTLQGKGTPGDTITLYDGPDPKTAKVLGTATVGPDGTWFATPTAPLAEGTKPIYVTATNAGGVESAPATTTVTVDKTAPVITVTSVAGDAVGGATLTGTFDAGERAGNDGVVLAGTTTAEVGQTVTIALNNKAYTTTVVAGAADQPNTWTYAVKGADANALNHGNSYALSVSVNDKAGNAGTDNAKSVAVDIAPPDVPTVNGQRTSDTTPTVTGLAQKETGAATGEYIALQTGDKLSVNLNGVSYELTIGGTSSRVVTIGGVPTTYLNQGELTYNVTTKQWSLTPKDAYALPKAEASYEVAVSVTAAGMTKTDLSSHELWVNALEPVITLNKVSTDDFINKVESQQPLQISGSVSSDVIAGSIVTLTGLDGSTRTAVVQADRSFSLTVPGEQASLFTDGVKPLQAQVTNSYNVSGTTTHIVSVDVTPPVVNDIPDITATSLQTLGNKIAGTVTEPNSTVKVTFPLSAGGTTTVTVTADATGKFLVEIPVGVELKRNDKITFVPTDPAGNVGLPVVEYYDPVPILSQVTLVHRDGVRYDLLNAGNVIDKESVVTTNLDEITGTTVPYATVTMAYTTAAGIAATKTATADEFGNYRFDLLTGKLVNGTFALAEKTVDTNADGTADTFEMVFTPNDTTATVTYVDAATNNPVTISITRNATTGVLSATGIPTNSGITLTGNSLFVPKTIVDGESLDNISGTEVIPNSVPERVVPAGQAVTVTESYTYATTAPANGYREVDDGTLAKQDADFVLIHADFNRDVILETTGGTPKLKVLVGDQVVYADFSKVIDGNTLEFKLTIQPGWNDANGISVPVSDTQAGGTTDINHNTNDPAIVLNGAKLYDKERFTKEGLKLDGWLDYFGQNGVGTPDNSYYKVDTLAPQATVTIFGVSTNNGWDPYYIDGDKNPATSTAATEEGDFNDEISSQQYSQNQGVWIGGKVEGEYRVGDRVTLTIRYMDLPAGYNQATTVPTASSDPTSNTVTPQLVEKTITVTADVQADGTWKTRMYAKDLAMDADLRIEARLDTFDDAGNRAVAYDTHQYTLGFFNIMSAQGMNDIADITTDIDPTNPKSDATGGNNVDTYGSMNTTTLLPFLQNTSNFGTGDEEAGTLNGTYGKNVNILTDLNWGVPYEYMRISSVMFEGETYNPGNAYANTYNYIDNASWGDKYWTANHFVRDGKVLVIANDNWHFGGFKYDTETQVNPYRWYDGGSLAAAFDFVGTYDDLSTPYAKGAVVGTTATFITKEALDKLSAPADAIAAAKQILDGVFSQKANTDLYGKTLSLKQEADTFSIRDEALTSKDVVLARDNNGNAIIVLRQHGAGYVLLSADQDIFDSTNLSKTSAGTSVEEILVGNVFAWADQYGARPVNATVDFASRPDYQYLHEGGLGWYYYRVGDTVELKLTVKGNATVDTTGGKPTIDLEIASDTWQAQYTKAVYNDRTGETTLFFDFLITDQVKSDYWYKVTAYSEGIHLPGNGFDANGATITINGKPGTIEYNDYRNSYEPYPDGWRYNPYQMVNTDPATPKAVVANGGLGFDLTPVGDFNGDGYEDFMVTAPGIVDNGTSRSSYVYVVYGGASGLPANLDLANLKASQGVIIDTSASGGDNYGYRFLNRLGDFNGDGYDDIMMTGHYADSTTVIWGGNRTTVGDTSYTIKSSEILASKWSTKEGFRIDGDGSWMGTAATAGDFNNDGYADIMVGNAEYYHGMATIVYGGKWQINTAGTQAGALTEWGMSNLFASFNASNTYSGVMKYIGATGETWRLVNSTDLSMLASGNSDFTFFGGQMAGYVDLNGDGLQDLVITDPHSDVKLSDGTAAVDGGSTWVIYGQAGKFVGEGVVTETTGQVYMSSKTTNDRNFDINWTNLEAMVSSGKAIRIDGTQKFESLGGSMFGGSVAGSANTLILGQTITSLGDINGDGFADLAIASPSYGNTASQYNGDGRVYVLYGSQNGLKLLGNTSNIYKLDALAPSAGFYLEQAVAGQKDITAHFGFAVQGMGDINGDGIDDFLVGAPEADDGPSLTNNGAVYLIWGSKAGVSLPTNTAYAESLVAQGKAVKFEGLKPSDFMGTNMALGDWDGDGLADFVIPSYGAETLTPNPADPAYGQGTVTINAGTFQVFMGAKYANMTNVGTKNDDQIDANDYRDNGVARITGAQGKDTITGIGANAADVAYGGAGNDSITIDSLNFQRVEGGLGIDTLKWGGSFTLDLAGVGQKVQGFETFDLAGKGGTLGLRLSDVLNQPEQSGVSFQALRVLGTSADKLDFAEALGTAAGLWAKKADAQTVDSVTFDVWHNSSLDAANQFGDVWVQQGVTVI